MNEAPKIFRNHCNWCGNILTSSKSIARGYGPSCWNKVKPKPIRPYIAEVPFTDTGGTDYMAKVYGEFENWRNEF